MIKRNRIIAIALCTLLAFPLAGCEEAGIFAEENAQMWENSGASSVAQVQEYDGEPYVVINDDEPDFTEDELQPEAYESYSELDGLGRCGVAEAVIGEELMPTEKRGNIGQVKPSGWQTVKYDNVDGKYLYNRCHLIGYQLTAENANEENLITGTRYMNVEGMLPFENMVADYIRETGNHVMYRVTPVFEGDNLVASGVQMEAKSVEDDGEEICYNVYVYNVQPGIEVDYATGDSREAEDTKETVNSDRKNNYILNTNTKKFHFSSCGGAEEIKKENKEEYTGTRTELIAQGYEPCGRCKP
ncbi:MULTISPECIES: DNA/RNA non-specific endonuclease [Lachnospiraceae]|uniref:DNA/RNA non-specific endonuclease n=1 Tax=Lachnospiraceae TaxID=186803 RepID=UPI003D03D8C5